MSSDSITLGELQVLLTTIAEALDRALEPKPSNLTRVDIIVEQLENEDLQGDPRALVRQLARLTGTWQAIDQESNAPPARPAYDQAEEDELGWCAECGQACGHRGHRHGQGDHGETVCEQCGVTLDPIT